MSNTVKERVVVPSQTTELDDSPPSHCIFDEPWWLDAVAPGRWAAAEVRKGDQLVARMPYVTRRKYGQTFIINPELTPTLGPWFKSSNVKYAKRLGEEKELIASLLAQLPPHAYCSIACHPSITNVLPFHWAGFRLRVRYTYTIPDLSDRDRIWTGLLTNVRGYIRKAKKHVVVRDDLGLDKFVETYEKTFLRQGRKLPFSRVLLERLDDALARQGQRRIFFAVDAREHVHAVVYLVWDNRAAYHLMAGGDPELRSSGAASLLAWQAIQHAATVSKVFDFEGSMIEPIERFFRAFGAIQRPYYKVTRATNFFMKVAMAAREIVR
ncbi:MAG: GNAT family N-acetyltransferase [Planctomycetota bacterium]